MAEQNKLAPAYVECVGAQMCPALLQATDFLDNSLLSLSRYLTLWKNLCNTCIL